MENWGLAEVPDLSGKVAVVTGANSGLGFEVASVLAQRDACVVLGVRNLERGRQAAERIRAAAPRAELVVQHIDLAWQQAVRQAAKELRARFDRIDLLINNAGVMYTPPQTTIDGFDLQFATNYLGHFTLTGLLLDRLLATPGSRVVNVSSLGHRIRSEITIDDVARPRHPEPVAAYGRSKLAVLLLTYELSRRLTAAGSAAIAVAAHPGSARTGLFRNAPRPYRLALAALSPTFQSAAMGARPILRAATGAGVTGGQYYGPRILGLRGGPVPVASSRRSHDRDLQARLWRLSEQLSGVTYPVR